MSQLSYDTFNIAHKYFENIADGQWMKVDKSAHEYTDSSWAWIGGITINMDGHHSSDMFLPLTFGIEYANGTKTDLMEETFGTAAVEFAKQKVEKSSSSILIIIIVILVVLVLVGVLIAYIHKSKARTSAVVDPSYAK